MPERCDLCILGGGAGGTTLAIAAAQLGASVVLIESGRLGGARLAGAVPMQALRATRGDFAAAMGSARRAVAALAVNDSAERLQALGVTVLPGFGRFTGPDEVAAGDRLIRARRYALATGAVGIGSGLTLETVWDLRERPEHLVVVGGDPRALELAQVFRRLGGAVTLATPALLPGEDEELVDVLRLALRRDGVTLCEGEQAPPEAGQVLVTGRRPRLDGLGLEAAGVAYSAHGVKVDAGLRTSNRRVYALGDVIGGPQYAHLAVHQAGLVLRSALFRLPVRNDLSVLPVVVHGDPGLARVGLTEAEARATRGRIEILRIALADTDRGRIDRAPGLCKALLDRRGRVVGAAIAGPQAGELILPWVLAVQRKLPASALAGVMAPYGTLSEVTKKAAVSHLLPRLLSDRMKTLVRWLRF